MEQQEESGSQKKIAKWAEAVGDVPKSQAIDGTGEIAEQDAKQAQPMGGPEIEHDNDEEARKSHFDRPLKEIRVGESPSRPWGISVPFAENAQPFAEVDSEEMKPGKNRDSPSVAPAVGLEAGNVEEPAEKEGRKMVFTGPVFFGYSTEDAAVIASRWKG